MISKDRILKEVLRCGRDPLYFINNYAKIKHPKKGLVSFRMFDFQSNLLKNFVDHRFNIVLKARQLGISTLSAAYAAWLILFNKDKNVLVLATKLKVAGNLVRKVKDIIKNLPDWLKLADINVDNRNAFELSNGSVIQASSTSSDAGRSEALSLLIVDEAAHVENMDDLWTSIYSTLSTGGGCIALSTPKGTGNWFHKTYSEAESDQNAFYPTKLLWNVHPERDEDWFVNETKNMSKRAIAQELLADFLASGDTVIDSDDLEKMATKIVIPKLRTGADRNLWIWEEREPSNSYLISADVARGDATDYSAFHVFNLQTLEQAAEYQGKINTDDYANLLYAVGKEYGFCMIVVENASIGHAVLQKLKLLNYPNIYYETKSTHDFVDPLTAEFTSNTIAGFATTVKTRPLIVAKLEEYIRNEVITVRSSRTVNELKTFIWHNGKPEAQKTYNDDLTMALAIACWIRDTALLQNKVELEYSKRLLGSIFKTSTIFNTSIPGQRGYSTQQRMKDSQAEYMKFSWVLRG